MTQQLEQWRPETVEDSALTLVAEDAEQNGTDQMLLDPDLMSLELEKEQNEDLEQLRPNSAGNRLVLENVQPETVSAIVKLLFDSKANIKMRLESTETAKQ